MNIIPILNSKKFNLNYTLTLSLALIFFGISCTPTKRLKTALPVYIEKSPIFEKSFTGFALYDPAKEDMVYEHNSDKYFTPASNTKILTFYASMKILNDFVPGLQYVKQGDSLIFWGTGNPAFLHPYIADDGVVFKFLKNAKEDLYFCPNNFHDKRFGSGWAWDDYPYYYQPERSPFPIYGNVVLVERDTLEKGFEVRPPIFNNYMNFNTDLGGSSPKITRGEFNNEFEYNAQAVTGEGYFKEVPFKYSDEFFVDLLRDTLKKPVQLLDLNILPNAFEDTRELYITNQGELYRFLMQHSDNFIAEQLMLMCSNRLYDTLNVKMAIQYAKDSLFRDLPDEPLWVDGSGLSRYNMFTPRSIVKILEKIHSELPEENVFGIFPSGGVSGTIKNWYAGENGPYVFAKTGTLSGKHCLSGYLKTKKGKTLIFSFMHNNFKGSSAPLKREMEKVLKRIYEEY
jgi:D-alanyl-D-alanine carboxypeptidase/D-alanyl-D-alanine-endopeptidase (penicillin-binding protein 4)